MAANYDSVLAQLQAFGLRPVLPLIYGRMVRCRVEGDREKRGWYSLHEIIGIGGDSLLIGSFGAWHGAENNAQKVQIRKESFSREHLEGMRRRIDEDRRRVNEERQRDADRAADRAAKTWAACSPTGDAEYLKRKGVGAHGIRFSPSGAIVLPLLDTTGKIHGLQVIRTKAEARVSKRLEKEFWPTGVIKKGHFHLIGVPTAVVLVTEGYATGASLHEATGFPTAIAFDAGNLGPVAAALHKRYKTAKILVCADDDAGQKCTACGRRVWLPVQPTDCPYCNEPHKQLNAGVSMASLAAVEVGGGWIKPIFAEEFERRKRFEDKGDKATDFNDLHHREGLHVVRHQVEARITELGWKVGQRAALNNGNRGAGDAPLNNLQSIDELLDRYSLVYGQGGMLYDSQEHCLVTLSDMRDACSRREIHRAWSEHPERSIVRIRNVGFDPGMEDPEVTCNLWAGWPTAPKGGNCQRLLDLLFHMCSADPNPEHLYRWVLKWLAYPIQHPGAKLKTAVVIHGPQGTGKNMFFEAVMAIYGPYGRVIDQGAIEDKFTDWLSRKLFLIADEVIARSDVYHIKNKLKTIITGEWCRINPKNLAAYDEKNHVNMVFLSNETMPVVLEEDDRRHAVIWTPDKLSAEFYAEVKREIDEGGAAALHDYLLNLNLDGFTSASWPPISAAKAELVHLSLDSTSRFYYELISEDIGCVRAMPALSQDVYDLYRAWCSRQGIARPAPQPRLINALAKKHRVPGGRERYMGQADIVGPHGLVILGDQHGPPEGTSRLNWLGDCVRAFRRAVNDYKGQSNA